uniref:Uncharacterized protein n=1 Tax=Timema poppense TaxID=170557 RepID=A0A7R9DR35_TIMPO|nr:unnamed protein product [Timema poppensis]
MACENSPYFKVNYASPKVITSLAPGMSVYFDIKFTPEEQRDYKHQITFLTEKTSFIVPVYLLDLDLYWIFLMQFTSQKHL